ncbi:MAG: FAD-binding domain-containing protein [Candidatus Puniceispirillaceae bacterium]
MRFAVARQEALARLEAFLPDAGSHYAKRRNYDYGQGAHNHVSGLSPALRRRTLCEEEVIKATLSHHRFASSEKFIQEVFWRTYWKGWLEMRPGLWSDYRAWLTKGPKDSAFLQAALTGTTDIPCFNDWHRELIETNYLHNHSRMWFASIWIHTLGLPWQSGAAFFMHHLSDGDPASNTLGWRWVAGLQTRGKAYAARADNIAQFTNGRHTPYGLLQEDVTAIDGPENPPAMTVRPPLSATGTRPLLILTPEDCHSESLTLPHKPVAVASLSSDLIPNRATSVMRDDEKALADGVNRAKAYYKVPSYAPVQANDGQDGLSQIFAQAKSDYQADHIVMAYQPVGYWHDFLSHNTLPITEIMRVYDHLCWPHAKKGFFPFKEKIPSFISSVTAGR